MGVRALFGPHVAVRQLWLPLEELPMPPEEEALVASVSPKRRREFAGGRWCARHALAELGVGGVPLLAERDRSPIWPIGVVGSIAHTDDYCVAVAGRRQVFAGLGVDAEPNEPLEPDVFEIICTADERRWLATRPPKEHGLLVRLLFSAKEAVYKCQYPLTKTMLDFHDLHVRIGHQYGTFTATFLRPAGERFETGSVLAGSYCLSNGLIRTGVALRLDGSGCA